VRVAVDHRGTAEGVPPGLEHRVGEAVAHLQAALYADVLQGVETVRVPVVFPDLSTRRLLTQGWGEAVAHLQRPAGEVQDLLALEPALREQAPGREVGDACSRRAGSRARRS
jgi:hypothetical protein